MSDIRIYRVIDANANRAREGLRVIEEITRLIFEQPQFTEEIKNYRHRITELVKDLDVKPGELLTARDSMHDVGSTIFNVDEFSRKDLHEIVGANLRRVQEAVRVLEEFSKLINSEVAMNFKELRFKLYSFEKRCSQLF